MFAAFIERSTRPAADLAASKKDRHQQGRICTSYEIRRKLDMGNRVAQFYEDRHGASSLRSLVKSYFDEESSPWRRRFPWGFWRDFIETELKMTF